MEEQQLQWYALKIFYNKVFEAELQLDGWDIDTYLAVRKVPLKGLEYLAAKRRLARMQADGLTDRQFVQEGVTIYKRIPLVNSLIFAKLTRQQAQEMDIRLRKEAGFNGFIYKEVQWTKDKETLKENRSLTPAQIPDRQMNAFRLVTESGDKGLEFFSDDSFTLFKQGTKVRVKEGPLKGTEGYIKRIRKDRRLLVSISGIVAVATSFIPPENLEPVTEE